MPDQALLLGINDYASISDLRGCINDVENITSLLTENFGFSERSIVQLQDDQVVKRAVKREFRKMCRAARSGDRLLFHYSGHGSHIISKDDDEPVDELICLYDMNFDDPDSYLLDDELGELFREVPEGVQLTVVLDCCHSGTGTRAITKSGNDAQKVDSRTWLAIESGRRSRSSKSRPVLARFVTPPRHLRPRQSELDRQTRHLGRSVRELNHLLLAGAADSETAADAYIGGSFNGAFSYYLCEAAREAEDRASADRVFQDAFDKIRGQNYSQTPQIEGIGRDRPLFGATDGKGGSGELNLTSDTAALVRAAKTIIQWAEDKGFDTYQNDRPSGNRSGTEEWVAVHGISHHPVGYSIPWFENIDRLVQKSLNRNEVRWSQHVNPERAGRSMMEDEDNARAAINAILEERLQVEILEHGDGESNLRAAARGGGIQIDDFMIYMFNRDIREDIINEFTRIVRPLLAAGKNLHIVSHSWGTVVAYEGLRRLESAELPGQVSTLFLVGSALSMGIVRNNLFSRVGDGRRPSMVQRWFNLNATGDLVGGSIKNHFAVDQEFLGLDPTGCFFINSGCCHSSYFNANNDAVNEDIFARFIDEASRERSVVDYSEPFEGSLNLEAVSYTRLLGLQEEVDDLLDSVHEPEIFDAGASERDWGLFGQRDQNKLAIVVGHTARSTGATGIAPINSSEYPWNRDLAERIERAASRRRIETRVFFRDNIGISGAYRQVAQWGADAAVELHFNNGGGSARGTETLYGPRVARSKDWAQRVQDRMVSLYNRRGSQNRGLRLAPPWPRGRASVNALRSIPSCLIEPFFGDNREDARLGEQLKDELAEALVRAFREFSSQRAVPVAEID